MTDPIVSYNTKLTPGVTNLTPAPALGPIYDYTPNLGLALVNFDWATWHDYEWDNWRTVDGILFSLLGITNIAGVWQPNTAYLQGQRVVGPDGRIYEANADFTSGDTFNASNWTVLSPNVPQSVGEWQTATNYSISDFIWSTPDEQYGVVNNNYTSGATWAEDVANGDITVLLDFTTLLDAYVQKAGDTITGDLDFANNAHIQFSNNVGGVGRNSTSALYLGYPTGARVEVTTLPVTYRKGVNLYSSFSYNATIYGTVSLTDDDFTYELSAAISRAPLTDLSILRKIDADALYSTSSVSVSDTPPSNPSNGDGWFCTVDPVGLFIWYDDGDSAQWVQANGASGDMDAAYLPIGGGTLTGPLYIGNVTPVSTIPSPGEGGMILSDGGIAVIQQLNRTAERQGGSTISLNASDGTNALGIFADTGNNGFAWQIFDDAGDVIAQASFDGRIYASTDLRYMSANSTMYLSVPPTASILNVRFGSASMYRFQDGGGVTSDTSIVNRGAGDARYQSASSILLKDDVQIAAPPDDFWSLDPISFTYGGTLTDDDPRRGRHTYGFSLEDMREAFPQAVKFDEFIDPVPLIAALYHEVKRLRTLVGAG